MQTTPKTPRREGGVATTIALLLLGLLLLGGVAMYCLTQLVPDIESDLNDRVTSALADKQLTSAQVEVAGTAVTLNGQLDSASNITQAEQIAQNVYGVGTVYSNLTVAGDNSTAALGKANAGNGSSADSQNTSKANSDTQEQDGSLVITSSLELVVKERKALLSGVLPDEATAQRIKSAVAATYGSDNIEDKVSIVPEAQTPSWLAGAESLISNIDKIENPSFKIAKSLSLIHI